MSSLNPFAKKGIVVSIIVIIGLFGMILLKETRKKQDIKEEIEALSAEADKIERENMKLEERISYLSSKEYQEIQAKDKLNMQNPGEKLIIITRNAAEKNPSESAEENHDVVRGENISNYKKWLNYFFK